MAVEDNWASASKHVSRDNKNGSNNVLMTSQTVIGEKQYFGPGGVRPNHTRPPDLNKSIISLSSLHQSFGEQQENEIYVDASENGISSNDEGDMELVEETQSLGHHEERDSVMQLVN
jgi:hypothetical protein